MPFKHTNLRIEKEYPKLVRDKIPEVILKKTGKSPKTRILKKGKEYLHYSLKKLIEESTELQHSIKAKNMKEELADVLEVIDAILKASKIKLKDVKKIQTKKAKERGKFTKRILMLGSVK